MAYLTPSSPPPLPEAIAVCPNCGHGGPRARFGRRRLGVIMESCRVQADAGGSISTEWDSPYDQEVEYISDESLGELFPDEKRYFCYRCRADFDEFKVISREEFLWRHMMESRRS